jgi:hypothetical protein
MPKMMRLARNRFRACKRWFDLSLGQYRSQLLRQRAARVGTF